jgi:hypothetical protein
MAAKKTQDSDLEHRRESRIKVSGDWERVESFLIVVFRRLNEALSTALLNLQRGGFLDRLAPRPVDRYMAIEQPCHRRRESLTDSAMPSHHIALPVSIPDCTWERRKNAGGCLEGRDGPPARQPGQTYNVH